MFDRSPTSGGRSVRRHFRSLAGVVALLACWGLIGCGGDASTSNANSSKDKADAQNDADNGLMNSAVSMFDVKTLGITTETDSAVELINQALLQSADKLGPSLAAAEDTWGRLLSPEQREQASSLDYTSRDGLHIWDALLSRDIVDVAMGTADTDEERVNNIFGFVVRNLPLAMRHPNDLPLTLQEIWTVGRGTLADRAWAFAALLRQMDIDSVLLAPEGDLETAGSPFLVGVLLGGEIYLYDPWLGIPIPAADGAATATLKEVVAQPELLANLKTADDRPYPLSAELMKRPRVMLISDLSFFSPRMRQVEEAFVGDDHVRLYDALQDEGDRPGYVSRVAEAGGEFWDADAISIWGYPEAQLAGHQNMTVSQLDTMRNLKDSWKAVWHDEKEGIAQTDGMSSDGQFGARVRQLVGDYADAIKLYVRIGKTNRDLFELQSGKLVPQLIPDVGQTQQFNADIDPDEQQRMENAYVYDQISRMPAGEQAKYLQWLVGQYQDTIRQHRIAAHDAAYWIGVCQFESGKLNAARNTFELYMQQFPQGGWASACRYYLALIHAAEGDDAAAAELLSVTPVTDPAYDAHQVQSRLWKANAAEKPAAGENGESGDAAANE